MEKPPQTLDFLKNVRYSLWFIRKRKKRMKNRQLAFTLIEVLIVIVVLGILATLAIPRYTSVRWKARFAEVFQTVGMISRAKEMFYLENNYYGRAGGYGLVGITVGNGVDPASTPVEDDLGIYIPRDSYFRYEIRPTSQNGATRNIRVYDQGFVYPNYFCRYDYVTRQWYVRPAKDKFGEASFYFRAPS